MTKLWIEFPMRILAGYHGCLGNLDVTLDDNIAWMIEKPFRTGFSIDSMERVAAEPGANEEFFRYAITIKESAPVPSAQMILEELTAGGFERGCTIRTPDGEILCSDEETADIVERRRIKAKTGRPSRRQ